MPRKAIAVGAMLLLAGSVGVGLTATATHPPRTDVVVTVDQATTVGSIGTRLGTQLVWAEGLDRTAEARERLNALAPPLVRINATAGPRDMTIVMPAGRVRGAWDFGGLDSLVNDVRASSAKVVLTIAYAPQWMWDCPAGTISDPTFAEFGAYMARLVGYYNAGSFVAEDGRVVRNPAGTANRIDYWELWSEPDQPSMGCPPEGNANLSVTRYVSMWNAAAARMLVVDPTIKLVGPATSTPDSGKTIDYLPALLDGASHRPDVISFHGYGGWRNAQDDRSLYDGQRGCCGLDEIVSGLRRARERAPAIPVWITELNVSSAWNEDDPTGRPFGGFGAAWGASAFLRLATGGADAIFQYQYAHPTLRQLSLIDVSTGRPLLPYWRDYYLARYFPPGSTLLWSSSSRDEIETLAARPPGSASVHVLVVNRQIGPVGGSGSPATVEVRVPDLAATTVTLRLLDNATGLDSGPASVDLPRGKVATVQFSGYGVALLEIVPGSGAMRTPTGALACFACRTER